MGNLLRLLTRDETPKYDIFVDFENAQPTEGERDTFIMAESVLRNSENILLELQQYKGAGNEIREAIANPRSENHQERAWEAVLPLVTKLKRFYEFSLQLEMIVPKILYQLCSGAHAPISHLETQQALVKQFAEILEFVLKFDDLKMTNPAIQNDFSYYRRTMSRLRMANQEEVENETNVSNELANRMSLFYAHATPMLKVLSDTTTKFVAENKDLPIENTTETLGTMAKVCQRMIENPELLATLGKDFNSDWMSVEKPKTLTIEPKADTLPPPHSILWTQLKKANLSHLVRQRLRHDGDNETIVAVEQWLMAKAACPIRYVWEDAGPLFWPRWIKRGDCSGPGERPCSWPPGMHCVPDASATLHVLRWQCRLPAAARRTSSHGAAASPGTLSPSSDVTTMPAVKCQWIRVPFPVTAECACAC